MFATIRYCFDMLPARSRAWWIMLVPIALGTGLLEAGAAAAVLALIRIVTDPSSIASMPPAAAIASRLPAMSDPALVLTFTALTIGYHISKNLLLVAAQFYRQRIVADSRAHLSMTMLRGYLAAPYAFQARRNSAELRRNVAALTSAVFEVLLSAATLLSEALVAAGLAIVLLWAAPLVALGSGAAIVILVAATLKWTKSRAFALGNVGHELIVDIDKVLQDAFGSLKELKVLGRGHYFDAGYTRLQQRWLSLGVMGTTLNTIPPLVIETAFVVGALLVIAIITVSGAAGPDGLPLLAVFTYAAFRLIPAINRMTWRINTIRSHNADVRAVHADFLAIAPFAQQRIEPAPAVRPQWSRLALERVSFAYDDTETDVLRDVTFELHRGETIGIVGATGAGKTTLIDVLLGLLAPSSGQRLVDGRPAAAGGPRAAYVPQAVFVADDTLISNVAFALDADAVDERRVHAAVETAQLGALVRQWPGGFSTMLGERGARLSGGERQRVGIARALYHDPDLLVLDEATSALDSITEAAVLDAIARLRLTTVMVAHRMSTVSRCDRLVVMVKGRIAATGSFDELMRTSPEFRELVEAAEAGVRDTWAAS